LKEVPLPTHPLTCACVEQCAGCSSENVKLANLLYIFFGTQEIKKFSYNPFFKIEISAICNYEILCMYIVYLTQNFILVSDDGLMKKPDFIFMDPCIAV
jgi:hypothetical protein